MSKIYECSMTETLTFNLKADNEEQAQEWLQTHSIKDVQKETTLYDINYAESVHNEVFNEDYGIDISENGEDMSPGRFRKLLGLVIDQMIEEEGMKVRPVINKLRDCGFTDNDFARLGFNYEDINDLSED
ncbi:MAG: hypothetical protein IJT36_01640 [Alphaproteobacteria bacterium]|nr:hypothetical protein [Alphaproteobacteria bacterium]